MGWQSYILGYNTDQEKEEIIKIIYDHNHNKNYDEIGEELYSIMTAEFKNKEEYKYCILCGHGGGRWSTFEWFDRYDLNVLPYDSSWKDNLINLKDCNMLEDLERNIAATIIQKIIRSKLARRYVIKLKYEPGGPGFIQAETEWNSKLHRFND